MKAFGKQEYAQTAYVNFESNNCLKESLRKILTSTESSPHYK
ncbi:hypothetical protein [Pedobacter sp. V48]